MAINANKEIPVSYRLYKNETDRDQVGEICRNVFGGTDVLPRIVSLLPEYDHCLPMVAVRGEEVVAFCNLRRLESDDNTTNVVYFERMRVSEAERGKGVGTALVREAMQVGASWCDSGGSTRFLSTTISQNSVMSTVFRKTGWACRGEVEMWPSFLTCAKIIKTTRDIRGRFLDALQVSEYVPHHALASLPAWQKLETPSQVSNTMQRIHAHGGYLMKPGYFAVDTIRNAAKLATGDGQSDARSVWKLERESSPPVLLFIQKANADRLQPLSADLVSACVVDVAGAESCVAFAASRKDLDAFSISFDPAITKDKMKSSTLLSQVDSTAFLIYEALR